MVPFVETRPLGIETHLRRILSPSHPEAHSSQNWVWLMRQISKKPDNHMYRDVNLTGQVVKRGCHFPHWLLGGQYPTVLLDLVEPAVPGLLLSQSCAWLAKPGYNRQVRVATQVVDFRFQKAFPFTRVDTIIDIGSDDFTYTFEGYINGGVRAGNLPEHYIIAEERFVQLAQRAYSFGRKLAQS